MLMSEHFRMMAGYNAWANARVYEASRQLTGLNFRADRGAFFKSVHGTLNHLLVTDRVWMARFTGTGDAPTSLTTILFDDFAGLQAARLAEDARISAYVAALTESDLGRVFRYRRVSTPEVYEQPLAPALAHLFNHQTHHRGQVHAVLTGLGASGPELDLLAYQRATGHGGFQVQD